LGSFFLSLPGGPAGPLHILSPWVIVLLKFLLAAAVAAVVVSVFLLLARQKKRRRQARRPYPGRLPPLSIEQRIVILRDFFLERKDYREGCHALSAEMKTWLESITAMQVEEMTVREITRSLGEDAGDFFRELGELQFDLRNPSKRKFAAMCKKAIELGHTAQGMTRRNV
jgi:hypothetical protein